MRISIACGGTGGHLFPGLAVAEVLHKRGNTVVLWVDQRAVESARDSGWSGGIEVIKASGFNGLSLKSVVTLFRLFASAVSCWKRMRRTRPDVVLAMGSYASFGPVVAAKLLKVPVVLHEANAIPGRAISFLSRFADVVAITFSDCFQYFKCLTELTGFPVRDDITPRFPNDSIFKKEVFTVLIMGGSQGAHKLNEVGSDAVCMLAEKGVRLQVIHLTGKNDVEVVQKKYAATDLRCLVYPFLKDMGKAYGVADVAVCRAGAATCMELAAFGLPALLVPLPSARRDHQTANAKVLVDAGAADMIDQKEFSVEMFVGYIERLMNDVDLLKNKKRCLAELAMPDAAEKIAELVEKAGFAD